ncbi:hypothetical protein MKK75_06925 [Methylobacterium sp. J-030]|uniref:hypothetical protein n=1 Tax=Methylobacterium sp. J-030 TaxID=2836627 RepID=UPI001FBAEFAF|nr:hypothetical protein [Methylobacterium sp. J-030]MCJ2068539.1 hypothetical protein [Methylobacterium sp. J-030]
MSEGIVPLRQKGEASSALDRFDIAAVALLIGDQAASLQAARAVVILNDLRAHRGQMTAVLVDVRGREPTGDPLIDEANANLVTAINSCIVQIDLFIARGQLILKEAAPSGANHPEVPK